MILKALKFSRFEGEPRQWQITGKAGDKPSFDNINLLVGKNSSGKSRTLSVIREIASLLSGRISLKEASYASERFEICLENKSSKYDYILAFKDRLVIDELLLVNSVEVLNRKKKKLLGIDNDTNIWVDVTDEQPMVTLASTTTNGYIAPLLEWGKSLKNYLFSNQIDKNHYIKDYSLLENKKQNIEDSSILIHTFHEGYTLHGRAFVDDIIANMQDMGYIISDISIENTPHGYAICTQENEKYRLSQREMSQGMFRALALFIQLSYSTLSKNSICLLIDDIGEGIDYERSIKLIEIVLRKIKDSPIQIFMTSNSRQVMNKIPLRYWNVIDACTSQSIFYNYANSKEVFDDFSYTGLNNYDFLATCFYKNGFGNIEE